MKGDDLIETFKIQILQGHFDCRIKEIFKLLTNVNLQDNELKIAWCSFKRNKS